MTIGILGGGQLGRMLALAAHPLGVEVRIMDPSPFAPAGHVAELELGEFTDQAVLARFAEGLRCVTYEFENVPAGAVRFLADRVPVYPPPEALESGQDRFHEKSLFRTLGIPVQRVLPVATAEEYQAALGEVGFPAVVKTRRLGYDGKGQFVLRDEGDAARAWKELRTAPLIIEEFVPFERELSLIGVRSVSGETAFYPLVENVHREGILRLSRVPAADDTLQATAESYARSIFEATRYAGVLTIEFFQRKGALIANEMAPRVHNSGHWTIEGASTSQFENHVRAVLDYPLGATSMTGHAAMVNLIGDVPEPAPILRLRDVHLHLYGKSGRPRRKVGHVTVLADTADHCAERVADVLRTLGYPPAESGIHL